MQLNSSENDEIQEQEEIQSSHWYHHTCKAFTVVAWINGSTISFRVISDLQNHPKYCSFLNTQGTIHRINLFSSGAAQHFKQQFFLNAVTLIPQFLGIYREELDITYNLFALQLLRKKLLHSGLGRGRRRILARTDTRKPQLKIL